MADLFHLWTAEFNELDYYLLADTKFINALRFPKPLQTPVVVCSLGEFLARVRS